MWNLLSKRGLFLLALIGLSLPGLGRAGGDQQITKDGYVDPKANELCPPNACVEQAVIDQCKSQFEAGLVKLLPAICTLSKTDFKTWLCDSSDSSKGMAVINQFAENFKQNSAYQAAHILCGKFVPVLKISQECGDGKINPGEECDDGNSVDGDGCSAKCDLEVPVDVDATCYQEKHDGPCNEQVVMCGNNLDTSQCGNDYNTCLTDALSDCQKSAMTPKDKAPAPDTKKAVPPTAPSDALSGGGCPLQMIPSHAASSGVNYLWIAMLLLPALRFRPRA